MVDILVVQEIVREAANLFKDRTAAEHTKMKGSCDFVTEVDTSVQNFIQGKLAELYPEIQFIGEEKENDEIDMNGMAWVLDPVDGTANLIHDYRHSAISLALMSGRESVMGIVYHPYMDDMFYAEKGKGAYLNGEPIHVTDESDFGNSMIIIGTSSYYKDEADENFDMFLRIFKDCLDVRRTGSAALDLAYVAAGRAEGFLEKHLKIWDFAAGMLIVREAGGEVCTYQGKKLTMVMRENVVAGNPHALPRLLTYSKKS